jgi:nucleoside-diphosphate-sugar epimerase
MKKNFFKSILIIGGTGFLGSHLCSFLIKKKKRVMSLSRKKPSKKFKINNVKYFQCDISKKKKLIQQLKKIKNVKYVINLGGEVDHKNSNKVYQSHFQGTKFLAEYFLNLKLTKFIQVGSSMEYGHYKSPQAEREVCKPISNYGKAKYLASKFLIDLNLKKNFPSIVLRPYQVYGPNQSDNRMIPYVIKNCLKNSSFPCSHGKQFRDFLYISDFLEAIYKLIISDKKTNGQIFNIGYGKPSNLKKLIILIKKKIKFGKPQFGIINMRNEENLKTYPNIVKIYKYIKWRPKISLEKGLKSTIKFYKNNNL